MCAHEIYQPTVGIEMLLIDKVFHHVVFFICFVIRNIYTAPRDRSTVGVINCRSYWVVTVTSFPIVKVGTRRFPDAIESFISYYLTGQWVQVLAMLFQRTPSTRKCSITAAIRSNLWHHFNFQL